MIKCAMRQIPTWSVKNLHENHKSKRKTQRTFWSLKLFSYMSITCLLLHSTDPWLGLRKKRSRSHNLWPFLQHLYHHWAVIWVLLSYFGQQHLQSLPLGGLAKMVHGHEKEQVGNHKPHPLGDKFLHFPHSGFVDDSTRTYLWVMVEMEKDDYGNSNAQSLLLPLPLLRHLRHHFPWQKKRKLGKAFKDQRKGFQLCCVYVYISTRKKLEICQIWLYLD